MSAHHRTRVITPSGPGYKALSTLALLVAIGLAGCAAPPPAAPPQDDTRCTVSDAGDPLVGSWLSVRRQAGVTGELRTHIMLNADGTMQYGEQLRRSGQAPQGLMETGCWRRDGQTLVLRTLESNGSPVDRDDPIYVNRYTLAPGASDRLGLQGADGVRLDARRMPSDYRLHW